MGRGAYSLLLCLAISLDFPERTQRNREWRWKGKRDWKGKMRGHCFQRCTENVYFFCLKKQKWHRQKNYSIFWGTSLTLIWIQMHLITRKNIEINIHKISERLSWIILKRCRPIPTQSVMQNCPTNSGLFINVCILLRSHLWALQIHFSESFFNHYHHATLSLKPCYTDKIIQAIASTLQAQALNLMLDFMR